ncbi:MAG: alpha/beta fold hydrolase [Ktedonobacteraceae bacterium]|nr:alpha/beta fold hydrolase [Ktedonobacteraceae bacterium]MBO0791231.1 alpha/beta fold hydrolase [Ktedonobacteraceae bacterium]
MPFVTIPDGTRLYYEESGEGEPLLLVSGQGQDHTFWNGVRDDFVNHYRVIVYDNRGTGQSDKPSEPPYSTRGFAQDAIALLDYLGIARAHAYGHSMGGRICQWLGIDHRQRIGALVLGATTPGNAHGVPRTAEVDALWTNPPADPQEALRAIGGLFLSPAWIETHLESVMAMFQAPPLPEYARTLHYLASEGHDTWDLLPTISMPTLVIHGSEDLMNPTANAYLLAERIPGAELSLIDGGRHGYLVEFREEASRIVNDFLARHPL